MTEQEIEEEILGRLGMVYCLPQHSRKQVDATLMADIAHALVGHIPKPHFTEEELDEILPKEISSDYYVKSDRKRLLAIGANQMRTDCKKALMRR